MALYDEDFRKEVERLGGEEGWNLGIVFSGGNVSVEALGKMFGTGETDASVDQKDKHEKNEKESAGIVNGDLHSQVNGEEREVGKIGLDGERVAENVAG